MGTYTDLLKLNRLTAPAVEDALPQPISPPPSRVVQATVWEQAAQRPDEERPNAETPDGESAQAPERRSAKTPNSRNAKRRSVRQGIDIYKDQLVSLSKLQFALWRRDDRKPTLRELVLTALDEYIERQKQILQEK